MCPALYGPPEAGPIVETYFFDDPSLYDDFNTIEQTPEPIHVHHGFKFFLVCFLLPTL